MTTHRIIFILLMSIMFNTAFAQQTITYNDNTFKPSEVIETQIGNTGETFSFVISELDMGPNGAWAKKIAELQRQGKTYDPSDAPTPLSIHLSVDFKRKFKFPITEEDSVYISYTSVKEKIMENDFNENQINNMDVSGMQKEGQNLEAKAKPIEEQMRNISKLMQEGKMSPEAAMKKIEALTAPLLNDIENSSALNNETEEFKESRATFDILFGNPEQKNEAVPFEGTLHIVEFNTERLVAYLKGVHYVECTDVARANDKSKPCENVETGLYPDHKVLRVEPVNITINTSFKTFYDNR